MNTDPSNSRQKYQITVNGILDPKWTDWFDGFEITPQADNRTILVGSIKDQASLHGLLDKIHNLGLSLLSLNRV